MRRERLVKMKGRGMINISTCMIYIKWLILIVIQRRPNEYKQNKFILSFIPIHHTPRIYLYSKAFNTDSLIRLSQLIISVDHNKFTALIKLKTKWDVAVLWLKWCRSVIDGFCFKYTVFCPILDDLRELLSVLYLIIFSRTRSSPPLIFVVSSAPIWLFALKIKMINFSLN